MNSKLQYHFKLVNPRGTLAIFATVYCVVYNAIKSKVKQKLDGIFFK